MLAFGGRYEVVKRMADLWLIAQSQRHKDYVLWETYDAFSKDLARYVTHKGNWLQRMSHGYYQLRACTAEQLKKADPTYIEAGEKGFLALLEHPNPLGAKVSSSKNMVLSAAADVCQVDNPKSIEVEPYPGKPRFSRDAAPQQCGAGEDCLGCGTAAREHSQGSTHAGLFFPPTGNDGNGESGDADEESSRVGAKKEVLAKISVGSQCGFVEMSLEQACWGPRECILHYYGARIGTKRTARWIVDKGEAYSWVMAHNITKKLRVYG